METDLGDTKVFPPYFYWKFSGIFSNTNTTFSKCGSEDPDLDPLLRKGGSEDPDPLFPNVDPRIRIRIHIKMRWIRNAVRNLITDFFFQVPQWLALIVPSSLLKVFKIVIVRPLNKKGPLRLWYSEPCFSCDGTGAECDYVRGKVFRVLLHL